MNSRKNGSAPGLLFQLSAPSVHVSVATWLTRVRMAPVALPNVVDTVLGATPTTVGTRRTYALVICPLTPARSNFRYDSRLSVAPLRFVNIDVSLPKLLVGDAWFT